MTPSYPARGTAAWAAWAVSFALLAVNVAFIGWTYSRSPFLDGFTLVPIATGEQAISLEWLLNPHYGHRLVLPKLVAAVALKASGNNFVALRFLNLLLLAISTGTFLLVLSEVRGRLVITDAVVPLLMIHPGYAFSLMHGFDLHFVLQTTLLSALVFCLLRLVRNHRSTISYGLTITRR